MLSVLTLQHSAIVLFLVIADLGTGLELDIPLMNPPEVRCGMSAMLRFRSLSLDPIALMLWLMTLTSTVLLLSPAVMLTQTLLLPLLLDSVRFLVGQAVIMELTGPPPALDIGIRPQRIGIFTAPNADMIPAVRPFTAPPGILGLFDLRMTIVVLPRM